MFSRVRIAIRFFFVGLAVGVLMAPRSGEQTRDMIRAKADGLLNSILEAASMGAESEPAAAPSSAPKARSGNGSAGRARSKAAEAKKAAADAGEEAADAVKEAASEAGV
ncbi:MAG TPA: YtxH domain-containing protein [Candidatus Limnocylindria bacterium]|jgi:gas vesicle protein